MSRFIQRQPVVSPTHKGLERDRTLELLFTNEHIFISSEPVLAAIIDHSLVVAKVNCSTLDLLVELQLGHVLYVGGI